MKVRVVKIDKPMFFVKEGTILIYNRAEGRYYSEDYEQWLPVELLEEAGAVLEVVQ